MTVDLTGLTAAPVAGDPHAVDQVADLAAGMDDSVPVVLLPVRLETRFVQVEEPVASPATLIDLAGRLADAARLLLLVASTDLATVREGTAAEHRKFKREIENPRCDLVAQRLDAAGMALDDVDALVRDPLDADERGMQAVAKAIGALRKALGGAADSLKGLRSVWQQERLGAQLDAVAKHADETLATLESRTLPAARLRAALHAPDVLTEAERIRADQRRRLLDPRLPDPRPSPVVTGTDGALPLSGVRVSPISNVTLADSAAAFESVLDGVRKLAEDPAAAARLTDEASTIALVPGDWKRELARAVEQARASGAVPEAAVDALAGTVAAIRSDEVALDASVPHRGLVVALPPATRLADRLLVRIYPDDIAVDVHEELLTAEERDAGAAFWQQTALAGTAEAAQRAAWRALCLGRGTRRAAWVARQTKPLAPAPTPGAKTAERVLAALTVFSKRVDEVAAGRPGPVRYDALLRAAEELLKALDIRAALPEPAIAKLRDGYTIARATIERLNREADREGLSPDVAAARELVIQTLERIENRLERLRVEPPPDPVVPDVGELKDGGWTRAARSGVLPDRFLVIAVKDGQIRHVAATGPVDAALKLSIDPDPDDPEAERFGLDGEGELVVGASIRWMIDYDEALAKGMAVTVSISAEEGNTGFDRVYAIGLCSGDAGDGAQRLETMLDNHHYGHGGLELLPVGTATNNTDSATAGYRSVEDPDAAFAVERGAPLVNEAAPADATAVDGLRVARALGVPATVLAHVAGADGRGGAEAQAVNAALYAATLGAALEEHAAPLISRDSRARLRAFALAHVAARGLVGTLRAGVQPYGLLPAIAYSRFETDDRDAPAPQDERAAQDRFDRLLGGVLGEMATDWAAIRDDRVSTATDPDVTDARAHFLELLGLEAVSATSSYRFAVNVAGRHGAAPGESELQFGIPPQSPEATPHSGVFGPFALLERFKGVLSDAFGVDPAAELLDKGQISAPWADVYTRLLDSRSYELRLLNNAHGLRGPAVGAAAELQALATATPAALAAATATNERHRSLLLLLARQALLLEWRDAALEVLLAEGLLDEAAIVEAGASAHFVVMSLTTPWSLTRWSYLFQPLKELDQLQGRSLQGALFTHLANGTVPLADFLTGTGPTSVTAYRSALYAPLAQRVRDAAGAVAALGAIPPERLEPLVREHLDLAGNRLDAWITGLAQRRLTAMRTAAPVGAHVGAYGWVENLRPDASHPLAPNVPPSLNGDPSRPVYVDLQSQGFIHAPSVGHAVTAAILRSGYLSQRSEADVENRMAVNLSSRRTRLALNLIDGVRAGNRLGTLLGYRLERFLHEYYATSGVTLDGVIGPLRRAFPSAAGVDAALSPDAAARQVCDGLAIADTVARFVAGAAAAGRTVYDVLSDGGHFTGHPWGLGTAIPPRSDPAALDGVIRAIDHVSDALDAVGDLVVAEAVHQIALGNHARAAAVVSALGEGKAPPRPEVVDTPRTGTPVTHRVLLQLPDAATLPAAWGALGMTPRATAEPALNAWAAELLGDPGDIRMRVVRAEGGVPAGEVTVAALGLQAIDLLAILGPGFETGLGEIATRVLDTLRPAELDDLAPPAPLQIVLERAVAWGPHVRSLAEIAPLLEAMDGLTGRARAADAHDYVAAEQPPDGDGPGVDDAELGSA